MYDIFFFTLFIKASNSIQPPIWLVLLLSKRVQEVWKNLADMLMTQELFYIQVQFRVGTAKISRKMCTLACLRKNSCSPAVYSLGVTKRSSGIEYKKLYWGKHVCKQEANPNSPIWMGLFLVSHKTRKRKIEKLIFFLSHENRFIEHLSFHHEHQMAYKRGWKFKKHYRVF